MKRSVVTSSIAGFVLLVAATAVACGGGSASSNGGSSDATQIPEGATEFVVSMQDNVYVPAKFAIKSGQTVTIVAKNEGTAIHNMSVLDTSMKSDALVQPGGESRFDIKFDRKGTFKFQCDYHLPDMVGEIVVN